jgi:hypothetical protein
MGKDSTKTQTTTLPPPTEQEKEMTAYQQAMIEVYLEQAGYESTTVQKTSYQNPALVESLERSASSLGTQKTRLENRLAELSKNPAVNAKEIAAIKGELTPIANQYNQINGQLMEEQKKATTSYEVELKEKPDPRIEILKSQGKVEEARALEESIKQDKLDTLNQKDRIEASYLDAIEKVVNGDMSINPEQAAQIKEIETFYKEPILNALGELKKEIGLTEQSTFASIANERGQIMTTKKSVSDALTGLENRIRQTGLDVGDALLEAEQRAKQNGVDMNTALDQTIEASRKLMENNLFEVMKDTRVANARLSASLGRSSTDSNMVERLNQQAMDAVKSAELTLASEAANGRLKVSEKTADALMGIADYKVNLRATQGSKLEGVALSRAQLEEQTGSKLEGLRGQETKAKVDTGLKLEDVARMRAGVEEAGAKVATGLRINAAQPTSMLQAGGSAINTLNTTDAGIASNWLGQAGNTVNSAVANEQNIRRSQGTTTVTESGNIFADLLGMIGVGASGTGSIMSGVGDLRK